MVQPPVSRQRLRARRHAGPGDAGAVGVQSGVSEPSLHLGGRGAARDCDSERQPICCRRARNIPPGSAARRDAGALTEKAISLAFAGLPALA